MDVLKYGRVKMGILSKYKIHHAKSDHMTHREMTNREMTHRELTHREMINYKAASGFAI